jgi:hypothetical protein
MAIPVYSNGLVWKCLNVWFAWYMEANSTSIVIPYSEREWFVFGIVTCACVKNILRRITIFNIYTGTYLLLALWGQSWPEREADHWHSHRFKNVRRFPSYHSAGIATGYGLDGRGSRVRFPAEAGNFSLHHHVQTGYWAHPTYYPIGTRGCFPGGKVAGAWS